MEVELPLRARTDGESQGAGVTYGVSVLPDSSSEPKSDSLSTSSVDSTCKSESDSCNAVAFFHVRACFAWSGQALLLDRSTSDMYFTAVLEVEGCGLMALILFWERACEPSCWRLWIAWVMDLDMAVDMGPMTCGMASVIDCCKSVSEGERLRGDSGLDAPGEARGSSSGSSP